MRQAGKWVQIFKSVNFSSHQIYTLLFISSNNLDARRTALECTFHIPAHPRPTVGSIAPLSLAKICLYALVDQKLPRCEVICCQASILPGMEFQASSPTFQRWRTFPKPTLNILEPEIRQIGYLMVKGHSLSLPSTPHRTHMSPPCSQTSLVCAMP